MQELLELLQQDNYTPGYKVIEKFKETCEYFHKLGYDSGYADANTNIANFLEEIVRKLRETND